MVNKAKNGMDEISKVVIGKEEMIKRVMTAILAGGHIMIQDIPGVGKTTMALAFARVLGLNYQRILFTPDLMPKDLAYYSVHHQRFGKREEEKETAHLLMADEINCSSPKIQSMLVKMMEDKKLKVDDHVTVLPDPYVVIATQNPLSLSGNMLPESQMDHFMIGISIGYPDMMSEIQMLKEENIREKILSLNEALEITDVLEIRNQVKHVYVSDQIYEYIVSIVNATRNNQLLEMGISPRGSFDILKMSKANAFLEGRDYVIPSDVKRILVDTASHRVRLSRYAKLENRKSGQILMTILEQIPVPRGMERKR
ncbi:MAG: MoxR family ATPase [Anaerostipes sp.]|uniref:AAA family ATPase n=1 Tax=Anaerostipes sp. 992a TaxID=1261637 RepID=UPI000951A56A|nr:MoxR family ATPase [Anaerostipes sp. 992a]MCI5951841.1 MoxR family ATPase [Anaerostipes sp.]MDD5969638.1 MoxR family ATPase [Anaerostipes sp.]OLR62125.1 AAA family ATPase [Anaerostipes sp. 992a]